MKKLTGIVFDFDGTLAELRIDFQLMKKRVGALAGVFLERPVSPNASPALEWIEELSLMLCEHDPAAVPEFKSRCGLLITAMEMEAAQKGRLFPFTLEVLERLRNQGLQLGVITRNCTAAVRVVFPEIECYVRVFLAREDAIRIKPHPDHLLQAVRFLGVNPWECLMVGDHRIDIQTAKRAGTLSGGVYSGKLSAGELQAEGPDFLAPDVSSLIRNIPSGMLPDRQIRSQ